MPQIKISNTSVAKITSPDAGKKTLYWDGELRGFGVSVTSSGTTFIVQTRIGRGRDAKLTRQTIGRFPEIDCTTARDRARKTLSELRDGNNPAAARKAKAVESLTLAEAHQSFKTSRTFRPRTLQTYDEVMKRTLSDWLDLPLNKINREMIQRRHKQITTAGRGGRGVSSANQAMRLVSAIFNYVDATHPELNLANPVEVLRKLRQFNKLEPRTQKIHEDDLARWYRGVTSVQSAKCRDYILFLLYSGLRRTEAAKLRWEDFDPSTRTLTIPKEYAKQKKTRQIPITNQLMEIYLRRRSERIVGNPHVFPGFRGKGHLTEPKRAINEAKEASGLADWSAHPVRRTYATIASKLDISHAKLKFLTGHSSGNDVTLKHYAQVSVDDVREAAQMIANHLQEKMQAVESLKKSSS